MRVARDPSPNGRKAIGGPRKSWSDNLNLGNVDDCFYLFILKIICKVHSFRSISSNETMQITSLLILVE